MKKLLRRIGGVERPNLDQVAVIVRRVAHHVEPQVADAHQGERVFVAFGAGALGVLAHVHDLLPRLAVRAGLDGVAIRPAVAQTAERDALRFLEWRRSGLSPELPSWIEKR